MQDFLNAAQATQCSLRRMRWKNFKIESSNYSAELGRSTGAALNASIKSGTNSIHGSLWEYLRNDRMAALDYNFAAPSPEPKTAYHQNIFGATLGGPIIKDKLFIFADGQAGRGSASINLSRRT